MDKNQISQGTHASVLYTHNRQLFFARFLLLALFLALSLMSLQPKSSANAARQTLRAGKVTLTSNQARAFAPDCSQQCEQQYVQCLASARDPLICDIAYDACLAACP